MKIKSFIKGTFLGTLAVFTVSALAAYPADVRMDTNSQSDVYVSVTTTSSAPWYCIDSEGNAINVTNQQVQPGFFTDCPYTVTYSGDGNNYQTCYFDKKFIYPTFTVHITRNSDNSLSCLLQPDNAKK